MMWWEGWIWQMNKRETWRERKRKRKCGPTPSFTLPTNVHVWIKIRWEYRSLGTLIAEVIIYSHSECVCDGEMAANLLVLVCFCFLSFLWWSWFKTFSGEDFGSRTQSHCSFFSFHGLFNLINITLCSAKIKEILLYLTWLIHSHNSFIPCTFV